MDYGVRVMVRVTQTRLVLAGLALTFVQVWLCAVTSLKDSDHALLGIWLNCGCVDCLPVHMHWRQAAALNVVFRFSVRLCSVLQCHDVSVNLVYRICII